MPRIYTLPLQTLSPGPYVLDVNAFNSNNADYIELIIQRGADGHWPGNEDTNILAVSMMFSDSSTQSGWLPGGDLYYRGVLQLEQRMLFHIPKIAGPDGLPTKKPVNSATATFIVNQTVDVGGTLRAI